MNFNFAFDNQVSNARGALKLKARVMIAAFTSVKNMMKKLIGNLHNSPPNRGLNRES